MNAPARGVLTVIVLALTPTLATAQKVGDHNANLPVPSSPALSVLDVAPEKATRPVSGGDVATSLVNVVDREGVLQNGLAIDFSPFLVTRGRRLERQSYVDRKALQFLSRAHVSVATTKATNVAKGAMRLALGGTFTLLDKGDPYLDGALADCLSKDMRAFLRAQPPAPPPPLNATAEERKEFTAAVAKIQAKREKEFKTDCRTAAAERLWNRTTIVVGIAPTWLSTTGAAGELESSGVASWGAAAYGFEGHGWLANHAQLVGYAEYRTKGTVPANEALGPATPESRLTTGARVRFGTSRAAASISVQHQRHRLETETKSTWSVEGASQHKLTDEVWLTLSVGGASKPTESGTQVFVLNSLSWKYGKQ